MSGTSRRWGSLSASAARAGEGGFLASASGRGSGSGLAGREQGCRVLGEQSEAAAVPGCPWRAQEPQWAPQASITPGAAGAPAATGAPNWVRPPPAPSPGEPWPPTPTPEKRLLVSTKADLASSGTICVEGAGGPWPGPRGQRAGQGGLSQDGAQRASRLSQSEERDPKELQDPGVRHGGVSRGPPHQQKSVDPKGPKSLLCHRFSTIPFATGKAFHSVF